MEDNIELRAGRALILAVKLRMTLDLFYESEEMQTLAFTQKDGTFAEYHGLDAVSATCDAIERAAKGR